MKIYHNPRCRKSRETLELIRSNGTEPEIVEYLKDIPSEKELSDLISKLGISAYDLIRRKEEAFKPFKGQDKTDAEWVKIMIEHPKLIERPIVVKDQKAVLGRPPENVNELF